MPTNQSQTTAQKWVWRLGAVLLAQLVTIVTVYALLIVFGAVAFSGGGQGQHCPEGRCPDGSVINQNGDVIQGKHGR